MPAYASDFLAGGGECGALARSCDWTTTPLGPVEDWPSPLQTAAEICLHSRFGMCVFWGPDYTAFYNDAYSPMLGIKHPAAMGMPLAAIWPEIWHEIGPMLDQVRSSGVASWQEDQRLVLERNGFPEAAYFTYSFSPIRGEDGEIAGVFTAVQETTGRVVSARRMGLITQLADRLSAARSYAEVAQASLASLAGAPEDVPLAVLYTLDALGGAVVEGAIGVPEGISPEQWTFAAESSGRGERQLSLSLPGGAAETALMLPIVAGPVGERPAAALLLAVSPQAMFDEDYRDFFRLIAQNIASALAGVAGYENERTRAQEIEAVALPLQRSLLPRELPRVSGVGLAGRYVPGSRLLEIGGDFYDAVDLGNGRVAITIGDVAGHGALAAAAMGQLLHAARAYTLEGHRPVSLMDRLDRLVSNFDLSMTTCLCGVFDVRTGSLEFANAGHPPPLIRRAGGEVERLEGALSQPLGMSAGSSHIQAAVELAVGDALLLYTDGLIERRGEALDIGIDRLAARLSEADPDPSGLCDRIVDELEPDFADDIALLALRREPRR